MTAVLAVFAASTARAQVFTCDSVAIKTRGVVFHDRHVRLGRLPSCHRAHRLLRRFAHLRRHDPSLCINTAHVLRSCRVGRWECSLSYDDRHPYYEGDCFRVGRDGFGIDVDFRERQRLREDSGYPGP